MIVNKSFPLDDYTTFDFSPKNGYQDSIHIRITGIRERRKGQTKKENTKKKDIDIYRKEDMVKYYSIDRGDLKLDETKEFIIYEKKELIFIPLCAANLNIVAYAVVSLSDYDKVKGKTFSRKIKGNRIYAACGTIRLHEIILGRKADPGGWKEIENYVDTEESRAAVWIQSESFPAPHLGKNWNYCKDKSGKVYIKMPGKTIDHRNSDGLDNRRQNLREVIFGLNAANKIKQKGTSSRYFGVCRKGKKWVGKVTYNGKGYEKCFEEEDDAAIFRDIYALILYKDIICNNGILTDEQTREILEKGEQVVPEKYRIKQKEERPLPKYIVMDQGKFKVKIFCP